MYLLYIFPPELHTLYDFNVLTSLTNPSKILLVVLENRKQEKPKTYQHPYICNDVAHNSHLIASDTRIND
jgi:hypothetical protein